MRTYFLTLGLFVAFAGCGSHSTTTQADAAGTGIDAPGTGVDAPGTGVDAPGTATVTITISGNASDASPNGGNGLANVAVSVLLASDNSQLATATTDALGDYTVMVTAPGPAIDLYVKGSVATYLDTYFYPARPPSASTTADLDMLDPAGVQQLSTATQGNQTAGHGLVAVVVNDAAANAVAGATVASTPAASSYHYNDAAGNPSRTATATAVGDGQAYLFNVPAGQVTVNATKTGTTFFAHTLTVRADAYTTTEIAP